MRSKNRNASPVCYAEDEEIRYEYKFTGNPAVKMDIRNIIFDLGNVIVDLDIPKTHQALYELTGVRHSDASPEDLMIFHDYETGKISEAIFLNYFIQKAVKSIQARDVIDAWNAMLTGIPWRRLEIMQKLMDKYQVFILSNNNETHLRWAHHYIQSRYHESGFANFAHHCYYSHKMGMRKPDAEIFTWVLNQHRLDAGKTLFFDDHPENVAAANDLGIQGVVVGPDQEILDLVHMKLPEI